MTVRVHGEEPKQSLALKVNGRKASKRRSRLEPAGRRSRSPVEPVDSGAARTSVVFETTGGKGKVALAWLRFGAIRPPGDQDPRARRRSMAGDTIELARRTRA